MPRPKSNKPKKGFLDGYKEYDPNDGIGKGDVNQWRTAWESMSGDEAIAILERDDPLAVMGFSEMPTSEELNRRFRDLMFIHHPDKGGELRKAQQITAAWTVLREKISRNRP